MKLTIKGGTIVSKSPPFDTYFNVMVPALKKMGADVKLDL
jgi:RNA 3'-terminal phosphate cyclase